MLDPPVHGPLGPDPLVHSFERHRYAENRSARRPTHQVSQAWPGTVMPRAAGPS
jgi:hypothetical protein